MALIGFQPFNYGHDHGHGYGQEFTDCGDGYVSPIGRTLLVTLFCYLAFCVFVIANPIVSPAFANELAHSQAQSGPQMNKPINVGRYSATNVETNYRSNSTEERSFQGSWAAALSGETRRDSASRQKSLSRGRIEFDLFYKLTPWVTLKAEPFLGFSNGFTQNDSVESSRTSVVEISEASVNLGNRKHRNKGPAQPRGFEYNFALGALNQNFIDPMILDEVTFTAARLETLFGESSQWKTSTQYAVPSTESVSNNSRDLNKTPHFSSILTDFHFGEALTESQTSRWLVRPGSPSQFQIGLGYMQFADLPFTLSSRSVLVGNTAISENPNSSGARFLNEEFRIALVRSRNQIKLSSLINLQLNGAYFQNTAAPAGYNTGYRVEMGLPVSLSEAWIFRPYGEWFYAEPDATVAYFSGRNYQTNRVGYFAGLDSFYLNPGLLSSSLRLRLATFEREVLFTSASQFREQGYFIGLGTSFDRF